MSSAWSTNVVDWQEINDEIIFQKLRLIYKDNCYGTNTKSLAIDNNWYMSQLIPVAVGDTITFFTASDIGTSSVQKSFVFNDEKNIVDYYGVSNNRTITITKGSFLSIPVRKEDAYNFKIFRNGELVYRGSMLVSDVASIAEEKDEQVIELLNEEKEFSGSAGYYFMKNRVVNVTPSIVYSSTCDIIGLIPIKAGDVIKCVSPSSLGAIGLYNSDKELVNAYTQTISRTITIPDGFSYISMNVLHGREDEFVMIKNGVVVWKAINSLFDEVLSIEFEANNKEVETQAKIQDLRDYSGKTEYEENYSRVNSVVKNNGASFITKNGWNTSKLIPVTIGDKVANVGFGIGVGLGLYDADGNLVTFYGQASNRTFTINNETYKYVSMSVDMSDALNFKLYINDELVYTGLETIPETFDYWSKRIETVEERMEPSSDIYENNSDKIDILRASQNYWLNENYRRLQLLAITDAHEDFEAVSRAVDFANRCPYIDGIIALGDNCGQGIPSVTVFERYYDIINASTKPVLSIPGNHDAGYDRRLRYSASNNVIYQYITAPSIRHLSQGEYIEGKTYFYHDFASRKIRVICLNEYDEDVEIEENIYWEAIPYNSALDKYVIDTEYAVGDEINFGLHTDNSFKCITAHTSSSDNELRPVGIRGFKYFGEEQMNWFVSALLSTPSNYGVVVCCHIPASRGYNTMCHDFKFCTNSWFHTNSSSMIGIAPDVLGIICDAFNKGESGSVKVIGNNGFQYMNTKTDGDISYAYQIDYDFTTKNSGAKFMLFACGHTHYDAIYKNAYNHYVVSPTYTTATTRQETDSDVPRSSDNKNIARDALTVFAFDTINNKVILTRVGTTATSDGYLRDLERIDLL